VTPEPPLPAPVPPGHQDFDVRHLEYFLAVVDHGSITRAAASMYRSQPSLSQAIRAFERALDVRLFRKEGRGLALTPAGEALVEPARRILADLGAARAAVESVVDLGSGHLSIATVQSLAAAQMAGLAAEMLRRHPRIRLSLHDAGASDAVADAVRTGRCEIGIAQAHAEGPALTAHHLADEHLHLVLPPDADPDTPDPVRLADLAGTDLVLSGPRSAARALVVQAFHDIGVEPRIVVESSASGAWHLVAEGAGVSFFADGLSDHVDLFGGLLRRTDPPITRPVVLLHRAAPLTPAARTFVELAVSWPWSGGSSQVGPHR
jgi:DNA-binding transcriptional LysR family regulator